MIEVENLSLVQGAFELRGVSLAVSSGSYGVLMGRTGCGKTSLLECIAGLRPMAGGRVRLHGQDVTVWPPGARGVGYLPQDGALFRTMTVREHLAFALVIRGWTDERIAERVRELAGWLGIDHLLDRRPVGLSGGEGQRAALGRALSFHPRVLLLDEPLSSLDEETRGQMIDLLKRLNQHENVTILHVTHNRDEAERLGDVHFQLDQGEIRGG
jgi:ABC-type sugar transport system ATPase subunit